MGDQTIHKSRVHIFFARDVVGWTKSSLELLKNLLHLKAVSVGTGNSVKLQTPDKKIKRFLRNELLCFNHSSFVTIKISWICPCTSDILNEIKKKKKKLKKKDNPMDTDLKERN